MITTAAPTCPTCTAVSGLVVLAVDPGRCTGWACSTGQAGAARFPHKTHGALGWRWGAWFSDVLIKISRTLVWLVPSVRISFPPPTTRGRDCLSGNAVSAKTL